MVQPIQWRLYFSGLPTNYPTSRILSWLLLGQGVGGAECVREQGDGVLECKECIKVATIVWRCDWRKKLDKLLPHLNRPWPGSSQESFRGYPGCFGQGSNARACNGGKYA